MNLDNVPYQSAFVYCSVSQFAFLSVRTLDDVVRLNKMMAAVGWSDRDCDGIPDHLDPDDDNDGYFDKKQVLHFLRNALN